MSADLSLIYAYEGGHDCDTTIRQTLVADDRYCKRKAKWYVETPTRNPLPIVDYACHQHVVSVLKERLG